jgi:hypothetical protein
MTEYQMGRGESRTFTITVTSAAGALVDLTDAEIYFVVRDLAGDVVLAKASTAAGGSDDEIEIPEQTEGEDPSDDRGQCYLKLTTSDTDIEQAARWADCWVVTAGDPPEQLKVDEHAPFYVTGAEPPTFA